MMKLYLIPLFKHEIFVRIFLDILIDLDTKVSLWSDPIICWEKSNSFSWLL